MIDGPIGHWLIRFYEFQKFKLILGRPETDNKTHFVAAKHSDRRKELVEDDHITRSTGTYTNRGNDHRGKRFYESHYRVYDLLFG